MPATTVPAQPRVAVAPKVPTLTEPAKVDPPSQTIPETPTTMPTENNASEPPASQPPASTAPATGSGSGTLSVSMDSLRILQRVDPIYPPMAKASHMQGTVVLRMTIDAQGLPADIQPISGPTALQDAALKAAQQWRFQPATQDGQAVPATFLLTMNFVLR